MPRREPATSRIELLQGTLDLIILQTLRWGPAHGFGIMKLIQSQSANTLHVETGSLYPALQRLLRQRVIASEWSVSESNRRVRTYRLTPKGRKRLAAERTQWNRMTEAMAALMLPPVADEP